MTRKHFTAIANAIKQTAEEYPHVPLNPIIDSLTPIFKEFNPNFDIERFRKACEPELKNLPQLTKFQEKINSVSNNL